MQHQRNAIVASSRTIARQLSRGLHGSTGTGAKAITQPVRPSTHAATVADGTVPIDQVSSVSQQAMFHQATEGQEWGLPPVARLQGAVDAFRQQHYVDELPSRTQKSIAEAAAGGKGYITPEDITRVLANITEGKSVITPREAGDICAAWGEKDGALESSSPAMSTNAFLKLLANRPN